MDKPKYLKRLEDKLNGLLRRVGVLEGSGGGGGGAASGVTVDNSSFKVLTFNNSQQLWEETDVALLNARATGIRFGGNLSDLGAGSVRITAGGGTILNITNPASPVYYNLSWSQTDLDLSGADDVYFIGVDNTGTVFSGTTEPSHADYRLNIWLWRVSIRGGVVSGTTFIGQPVQQGVAQVWDIWRALGFIKKDIVLSPASTDLTLAHSAGEIYVPGINFQTSALNPHELDVAATSPITFRHVTANGTQTADRTALDVGNYDLNNVVTAIPGATSRAQIMTIKLFPGSTNYRIFRGQEFFDNVTQALEALVQGTYTFVEPDAYQNAVTLGWAIVQKGATNLNDGVQVLVTANKFGLTGGAVNTSSFPSLVPNTFTGTVVSLNNILGNYQVAAANSATAYTTTGTTLGAFARIRINAATEPTVTGGTKLFGPDFQADTDMYLIVEYTYRVEYYFVRIT